MISNPLKNQHLRLNTCKIRQRVDRFRWMASDSKRLSLRTSNRSALYAFAWYALQIYYIIKVRVDSDTRNFERDTRIRFTVKSPLFDPCSCMAGRLKGMIALYTRENVSRWSEEGNREVLREDGCIEELKIGLRRVCNAYILLYARVYTRCGVFRSIDLRY